MGDAAPLIILLAVIVLWMYLWSLRQRAKTRPHPTAVFHAPSSTGTSNLIASSAVEEGTPTRTRLVNAVPAKDARPARLLDPHDPIVSSAVEKGTPTRTRLMNAAPAKDARPARLLDPHDPLARRYAEVAAQFEPTATVVAALPTVLRDRVAMRAMIMAAQSELVSIRSALPADNLASQSVLFRQIEQIDRQFARVRTDAQSIAAGYARYTQLFEQLSAGATTLRQALDELAQLAQFPLVWSFTGPISTQAIRLAKGLPPPYSSEATTI